MNDIDGDKDRLDQGTANALSAASVLTTAATASKTLRIPAGRTPPLCLASATEQV
jgi:hypothetical protein